MVRCTSFISYRVTKLFNTAFEWLGESIYKKPWLFIIIGIAVTMAAGSGIIYIEQETATINLWVPTTTKIYSNFKAEENFFGAYPQILVLLLEGRDNKNIMTPSGLNEAYNAMRTISNISSEYGGVKYNFADTCSRADITSNSCVSDNVNIHSMFFKDNKTLWTDQDRIDKVLNTEGVNFFLGSLQYDDIVTVNTNVIGANVIRIIYPLAPTTDNDLKEVLKEYQRAWINYWLDHKNDYNEFEAVFYASQAQDDEMLATMTADSVMFVIAFIVMLVYLQLTLGGFSCVGMRALLATSSIFVLICALIFGFGISAYLGMKFSTLVFVVPFLLLGVGVDDMIIIVDTVNHTKIANSDQQLQYTAKQLGVALKHCGVSVTLTSFCSVIAFFAGTLTDLPGLQYFCYYAAFSFLGNYILQFLLFVPLLVYDNKRIQANRNFCCLCFTHKAIQNNDETDDNISGSWYSAKMFSLDWILQNSFIKILSSTVGRICVIIIFCVFIGVSGYYGTKIESTSDPRLFILDDSYLSQYFDLIDVAWSGATLETINIVFIDVDFAEPSMRKRIYSLMDEVEKLSDVDGEVENWLEPFTQYLKDKKNVNIDDITDKLTFYEYLKDFEQENEFVHWDDELVFDNDNYPTKISATRFYFTALQPPNMHAKYVSYKFYNELTDQVMGTDIECFMNQAFWVYTYFSYNLREYALNNLMISTAAVLLILLLLMDIRLAFFIMLVIVGIDVCLFGWMYMIGIDLQPVSFSQLCMAVGLTVDYVIHMTHSIAEVRLDSNNNIFGNRIKVAMIQTGSSVIKGAMTTFVGSCVLAFAGSLAFRMFFNLLAGIIVVASLFGLLFAPALMGQLPFIYSGIDVLHIEMEDESIEYQGVSVVDAYDKNDEKENDSDENL